MSAEPKRIEHNPEFKKLTAIKQEVYALAVGVLVGDSEVAAAIIQTKLQFVMDRFHDDISSYDWGPQIRFTQKKGKDVMLVWGCYCVAYHEHIGEYPDEKIEFGKRDGRYGGFRVKPIRRFKKSFGHQSQFLPQNLMRYFRWYIKSCGQVFYWGLEVQKISRWINEGEVVEMNGNELIELFQSEYEKKYELEYRVEVAETGKIHILQKLLRKNNASPSDYARWFFGTYASKWRYPPTLKQFSGQTASHAFIIGKDQVHESADVDVDEFVKRAEQRRQ